MSARSPIELCCEKLIIEILERSIPASTGILVIPSIDVRNVTGRARITVRCEDNGHELSMKKNGTCARKIKASIIMRTSMDDHTSDWMEAESVTVTNALDEPPRPLANITPFSWFSIVERNASNLAFDKREWVKAFMLDITAKLAN